MVHFISSIWTKSHYRTDERWEDFDNSLSISDIDYQNKKVTLK